MSCDHNQTTRKKVDIEYFGGLKFSAKMEVCDACDAYLWTEDSKDLLNEWLAEQKRINRDHFILQVSISARSKRCLDEIGKNHPGANTSSLIRAMTSVFFHFMEEPKFAEFFEAVALGEVYNSFLHGEKHLTKVQFSPSGLIDLYSWSKLLNIRPTKLVEEAVYRITSTYVDGDPELKKFWNMHILPQISLILKSVA